MLNNKQNIYLIFSGIIVFCSRLPFLSIGYGVEEDSWGIALAAYHTHSTGILEVSRFPGHPFQEIIYSLLWGIGPFGFNLLSALFSVVAFVYMYLILKEHKIQVPLLGAIAFSFIPVVYIGSTYTIDYIWTCALVLMSYYFLLKNKIVFCALFLGLAIACRITSGAMLLPYLIILWYSGSKTTFFKKSILLISISTLIGIIFFIPVYLRYGTAFFMYYDQFPYPPLTKVIYKYSIGAWGLIGLITIFANAICIMLRKGKTKNENTAQIPKAHFIAWGLIFVLYTISYFRLPQKSAYVIPIIPFIVLAAGTLLNRRFYIISCICLILSSFFFSINLTDTARGSESSAAAFKFTVSGQEIFIDPFTGPIFSDFSKRKLKQNYSEQIIASTNNIEHKTAIIAGWWANEIETELINRNKNPLVKFETYIDQTRIDKYLKEDYKIYFLPEQNLYNDQMFGMNITDSVAKPYIP